MPTAEIILYIRLFDAKIISGEKMVVVAMTLVVLDNPNKHLAQTHLINNILHHMDSLLSVSEFYGPASLWILFQIQIMQIGMT